MALCVARAFTSHIKTLHRSSMAACAEKVVLLNVKCAREP